MYKFHVSRQISISSYLKPMQNCAKLCLPCRKVCQMIGHAFNSLSLPHPHCRECVKVSV